MPATTSTILATDHDVERILNPNYMHLSVAEEELKEAEGRVERGGGRS